MRAPSPSVRKKGSTSSSVERPEMQELLTSRGSSHFESAVISAMFGVTSHLGVILKAQEVLLDRIESIAQKMEILKKEVNSLVISPRPMNNSLSSELPSEEEIQAWLNSPIPTQERLGAMDLTCSETLNCSLPQSLEQTYLWNGSMDLPVWARADVPTTPSLTPILKSQEQSGGTATCKRKKSS